MRHATTYDTNEEDKIVEREEGLAKNSNRPFGPLHGHSTMNEDTFNQYGSNNYFGKDYRSGRNRLNTGKL